MDSNKNEALQPKEVAETFWTSCNRCNVQFEYAKMYVNQNLMSLCCKQPFLAIEVPAPLVTSYSSLPVSRQLQIMPISSSGRKRTSEAARSSKSLKRMNEGVTRNNEAPKKSSSTAPKMLQAASVSAPSAVYRSVKKLSRVQIRDMMQEKAKAELITFITLCESNIVG